MLLYLPYTSPGDDSPLDEESPHSDDDERQIPAEKISHIINFQITYLSFTLTNIVTLCVIRQVLPDASDQQAGYRVHRTGDVRMEHVSTTVLGLLPRRRLLPQAI